MRCSVCGERKARNVYSSKLAPVSLAFCQNCVTAGAEPYHIILSKISNLPNPMDRSQQIQEIIEATLKIIGMEKEQFEKDVMRKIKQRNERSTIEKIKGGLIGLAIGDALGGTTEFLSEQEIVTKYGVVDQIIGGGIWNLKPGEVTDDTAMTMAVAKGIIQNPADPIPSIGDHFLQWFATKPKDVGNIIANVLVHYNDDWYKTAEMVHYQLNEKSAGNGSLMRCLPIAFAYTNITDIEEISIKQSKMTHFSDEASQACVIYNRIAYRIMNDEPLIDAIEKEVKNTPYETAMKQKPNVSPDGYVVHTLLWVIYHLTHCETFEEVVIQAANKGGDTDTIAAIAGGLKGMEAGYMNIPNDLKNCIIVKDELMKLAEELYQVRTKFSLNVDENKCRLK